MATPPRFHRPCSCNRLAEPEPRAAKCRSTASASAATARQCMLRLRRRMASMRGMGNPPHSEPKPLTLDRETLLARLLDLVSERTGYPKEALEHRPRPGSRPRRRFDQARRGARCLAESHRGRRRRQAPNLEMEKLSGHQDAPRYRGLRDGANDAVSAPTPPLPPTARTNSTAAPAPERRPATPGGARATCSGSSSG